MPARLGYNRAINRDRPAPNEFEGELDTPGSMRAISFAGLSSLLRERARRPAFSPSSPRKAWPLAGPVFAVERGEGRDAVLALVNCSEQAATVELPGPWIGTAAGFDPVGGRALSPRRTAGGALRLEGYQVLWLERQGDD